MTHSISDFQEESFKCIRCGLCQMVCPIYAELGSEPAVARGKVRLVKELIDGNITVSPRFKEIMDLCLNCKACVANCPPAVHTDKLVLAARAHIADKVGLPFPVKAALQNFLPNNDMQGFAAKMAYFYQISGMQKLVRTSGILKAVSTDMAHQESLMPNFAPQTFRSILFQRSQKKGGKIRVAYFISCMTNMVNPALGKAVIDVLERHGCEVVIPTDVQCCGTPHLAYGDREMAKKLVAHNVKLLMETGAEVIVTDCATCGGVLKEYGELLPEATDFAKKVRDVSEFLVDTIGVKAGNKPTEAIVTYHDSCHLNRGQGVKAQPREILKAIPGLVFKEMSESDRCCGSAGSFGMTHYELSQRILDRKLNNAATVNAAIIATGCPACRMQINHGIARRNLPMTVEHPIELLAKTF
ncbi:(Fe-S)-binding protein [Sporomusa malonica]|uniref:Glycolate oxidase iron-sulfur subunit n=1 Tax=Sporomusa malonica TaxID=112901 RepID=A0A1W2APE3_9FIRM|nr:(Fe-S)-binding protein [Sporomusa malonica]SMC62599.1 glycolate oxidase iron-sulfur subunit [Sporomusa malonica]